MFDAAIDQLVYDFNVAPLSYVDGTWIASRHRNSVLLLAESADPQARAAASAWLLDSLDLSSRSDFDFSDAHKRLLLLEPMVLRDVALFVGLSSLTPMLRHWLDAAAQRHVLAELGESAYAFFCRQVLPLPAVATLGLSPEKTARLRQPSQLLRIASRCGASLLFACGGGLQTPAVQRARLKFARAVGGVQKCPDLSPEDVQRVGELAIGRVLRERHRAWHWLF
jgi:YOP proteins translocation protein K (YscK)